MSEAPQPGHNGQLQRYVDRIIALEDRFDEITDQQMGAMREIGTLYWRYGWRGKDGRRLPNPMPRFLSWVEPSSETTCWNWRGSTNVAKYGMFSFGGQYVLAHRWAVAVTKGLRGSPFVVDHKCGNTNCVNPAHLEEVTQSENVRRGIHRSPKREPPTHCKHGHPLSNSNVYFCPRGRRSCRICGTRRKLAWQRANRDGK